MNKVIKRVDKGQKGQSIIEFALFLPIILLIVFIAIQISIIAYYRLLVNQVLTDIARTVAVTENPDDVVCQNRIESILEFYTEKAIIPVDFTDDDLFDWDWIRETTPTSGQMVIVSCDYQGMRLPFVMEYVIHDSICYPSVFSTVAGP